MTRTNQQLTMRRFDLENSVVSLLFVYTNGNCNAVSGRMSWSKVPTAMMGSSVHPTFQPAPSHDSNMVVPLLPLKYPNRYSVMTMTMFL